MKHPPLPPAIIESAIHTVHGLKVIFDRDLAAIYGVPTHRFNEAVKRNRQRFPGDFMFQLTAKEHAILRSRFAISRSDWGGRRVPPYAFTEHGAIMAANILRSARAVQMSVFVVRAFVRMRRILGSPRELARKLEELETNLTSRLDVHEIAILDVLRNIRLLLDHEPAPELPHRRIGFQASRPGREEIRAADPFDGARSGRRISRQSANAPFTPPISRPSSAK